MVTLYGIFQNMGDDIFVLTGGCVYGDATLADRVLDHIQQHSDFPDDFTVREIEYKDS